jgi:hypothetical protein
MKDRLEQICDQYDDALTECDGHTRVLHTLLHQEGISHDVLIGVIEVDSYHMPHWWITVTDPDTCGTWTIDYRLRMWLQHVFPDLDIPHGVFQAEDFPALIYQGRAIDLEPLDSRMFHELANSSRLLMVNNVKYVF